MNPKETVEYWDKLFDELFEDVGPHVITVIEDDDVPIIIPPLDESE
jgi:hypothetical protein